MMLKDLRCGPARKQSIDRRDPFTGAIRRPSADGRLGHSGSIVIRIGEREASSVKQFIWYFYMSHANTVLKYTRV